MKNVDFYNPWGVKAFRVIKINEAKIEAVIGLSASTDRFCPLNIASKLKVHNLPGPERSPDTLFQCYSFIGTQCTPPSPFTPYNKVSKNLFSGVGPKSKIPAWVLFSCESVIN